MNVFAFLLKVCRPFKWHIFGCLCTSIIWAIDMSLRPYLTKCLIDTIGKGAGFGASSETISFYAALYLAAAFMVFILYSFEEKLWLSFVNNLKRSIGNRLTKTVLKKSYSFYQNHFSGSLASNINNCIGSVPRLIKIFNESFLRYSLGIFISVYTLWQVNFRFALGLGLWIALYLGSSFIAAPYVRKFSADATQESSQGIGYIIDILSNILNVKGFSQEEKETLKVNENFTRWFHLIWKRDRILVNLYILQSGSFIVLQALCFKWLLSGISQNVLTAGDFVLVFTISLSICTCLSSFTRTIADFSENLGIVDAALKILYTPREIRDKVPAQTLQVTKGRIEFDNVQFHYKGAETLFQNKSVTIEAGEKVGLVGYSGSGKTTFVNLILRLFDVSSGRIQIDGQDIRDVTQASLRNAIGMIPQEPVLFHRTLAQNICYGKQDATEAQIQAAAVKAFADPFIEKLPNRYRSLVGERGIKLSGGQRQRIAMARVILKNAPILILDEATSQLDSVTENEIQKSLWALMEGKTTLIIAHRLSTLLHMDRLLVFDRGKIVEEGTHQELMEKNGHYKKLWEAQVRGFLPEQEV